MGTAPSKPTSEFTEKQRQQVTMVGQAKDLADALATLDMNGVATSESGSLGSSNLKEWERAAAKVSQTLHMA
jgi:hypothetical protein